MKRLIYVDHPEAEKILGNPKKDTEVVVRFYEKFGGFIYYRIVGYKMTRPNGEEVAAREDCFIEPSKLQSELAYKELYEEKKKDLTDVPERVFTTEAKF